jgi:SAM-dependent methyltransferase
MRPDIVNLRQFYSSPLGKKVRRRLRRMVRGYWPEEKSLHVVGVGYTSDVLPRPDARADSRIVALMPTAQGAIYWPVNEENHSVLADEMRPPFTTASLHRVLMLHGFEYAAAPDELLRVWWQLLVPGGRLMMVVPNRHGLWARFGATPFATGTPYTLATLRQLFNAAGFTLRNTRSALFVPPSTHPLWLACFGVFEWFGVALCPRMGGVLLIEAEKQIYAGVRVTPSSMKPARQWKAAAVVASSRDQ